MADGAYANKIPWPRQPEMVETTLYGPVTVTTYSKFTSTAPQKAWVLWHRYLDGSGSHIERVYLDEKRATEDYKLLTAQWTPSGSERQLTELTITG